jgi:hypothetical protein
MICSSFGFAGILFSPTIYYNILMFELENNASNITQLDWQKKLVELLTEYGHQTRTTYVTNLILEV